MSDKAGFIEFIRAAGITTTYLPDASTDIDTALSIATEIVYQGLMTISPVMYDQAVYNLGVSNLIEFANDQTGQTFFKDQRKLYNINGLVPGVIASASDEGTSESMLNPDFFKNLTMADLQYIKNPWGRAYLSIAQRVGTVWGRS